MNKRTILILLLAAVCVRTQAQFSETIFYDTLSSPTKDGYIRSGLADGRYMYLGGASFSELNPLPTITKMDTSGVVVWTAIDHDNYGRFGSYFGFENSKATCSNLVKSGSRIYAIASGHSQVQPNVYLDEVWCVSDSGGTLIWKLSINNERIMRLVDYSSTELLVMTGYNTIAYHVVNKATGKVVFTKPFNIFGVPSSGIPNLYVDRDKNVLISWYDSCRKYRDNRLNQLLWISNVPNGGSFRPIEKVVQDSGRYIIMGRNYIRAVDSATGSTIWFKPIQVGFILGTQSGGDGDPRDFILKDSILHVTWTSPFVGGVDLKRGFTLTRINTYNGYVRYNVAHDFNGIPADPVPNLNDDLDWPVSMCMDENKNIYITGSYDRAPGMESPGNWGIMKISYQTGVKIFESTITEDSTRRMERSQGRFISYFNGRIYTAGNLQKKESNLYAKPILASFDTTAAYSEKYRVGISYAFRYASALVGATPFSTSKMILLKKLGRSAVIEMRGGNNQPVWSRTFNSAGKFMVPQNIRNLADTGIAASFILYRQDTSNKVVPKEPDSLVFVRLDTLGNVKFRHQVLINTNDTFTSVQAYHDKNNRSNFVIRRKTGSITSFLMYTLNSTFPNLGGIGSLEAVETDPLTIRINPVQQFNGDTAAVHQAGNGGLARAWLFSATQSAIGFNFYGFRPLRHFDKVYSSLAIAPATFLVMGRDSSGQTRTSRYDYRLANPLVWTYAPGINGNMYNADTSATALYVVSKHFTGNKLAVTKLNRQTGIAAWTVEKTPGTGKGYMPTDFTYEPINRQIIVGGWLSDSAVANIKSSYFYLVLDSNGNIIKDIIRDGQGASGTKINTTWAMQNGTLAYGGALSTSEWGMAGFYNSECIGNNVVPAVSITASNTTACASTPITFTANTINGGATPSYQWQVNGINTGDNSGIFIATLNNNDQVKVILTSNANCLQTPNATSNIITVTIQPRLTPAVTIAGNTTVNSGQATLITATPLSTGANPIYQWQDSTTTHNWQNIAGATGITINHTPVATGDKLRFLVTSTDNCVHPANATSNVLAFTVTVVTAINPVPSSQYGIKYYPNPVKDYLVLDSLKLTDQWQTLEIKAMDGKQSLLTVSVQNKTRIQFSTAALPKGVYLAVLKRKNGGTVYIEFVKL
jgi:hypothetical protein